MEYLLTWVLVLPYMGTAPALFQPVKVTIPVIQNRMMSWGISNSLNHYLFAAGLKLDFCCTLLEVDIPVSLVDI